MKKILLGLLYLASLLLLAGTGVVHYFTRAKMGMARYMVYFNGKIDDRLGGVGKGKVLLVMLIVIVSLITISLIVLTFKNLRGSLINKIPADLACIINAFSLFYISITNFIIIFSNIFSYCITFFAMASAKILICYICIYSNYFT